MGIGTIARRTFLVGSVAVAGGVAFGAYAIKKPFANPNLKDLQDGEASFNPWVIVDSKKVTLIAPHADKGQGIFSAQALLIAEELDIELDQVAISFGMPDTAYYNRGLAASSVPFMSVDNSDQAEFFRGVAGAAIKMLMPMMVTGGSSAIPDSFDKLRQAGAVARETLKAAAAKKAGVKRSELKTANGAVILPDGSSLKYTELAETASRIKPVTNVTLRQPSEWRLVGKSTQRVDIVGKSTGTQTYGIDHEMDGLLHAAIRVNPRQGGPLNGYDATDAKKMRGVKKIVEITDGVAVIADNTWRAIRAAEAVKCDWGAAPYPAEQEEHWEVLSNSFNEEQLNALARDEGDVETALAAGGDYAAEYRSPYVAHAPLEPLNATILVTDQGVDIWTGHQIQLLAEQWVADITGHDVDNVRLHNMFMGGSFGHRLELEFLKQAAEIANQMRGVPVKLTYSREEDFAHDFPRHITIGRGRGTVADGKVEAIDIQIAAPSVVASQFGRAGIDMPGPDAQLHEGAWDNPYYNLPNLRVRSYKAQDLAPVSSWRSVGAAPNGFIFDCFLDELIHEAGADPMEERIRLMGHEVSRKVLETVAEMSSWGSTLGPQKARGVSFVISFGVPVALVVEVTNTPRGITVDKAWLAADVGTVIDPVNFENLGQGGVVFGLGHAMNCEITYSDGMAEQSNFHQHEAMRLYQCPEIHIKGLENAEKIRGFGEPPVPPCAPALANAIFAATGKRIRELPLNKHVKFV